MSKIPVTTYQAYMGTTEIATLLGVSRQRADQISQKKGFPDPVAHLTMGRIWSTDDVMDWARRFRQRRPLPPLAQTSELGYR